MTLLGIKSGRAWLALFHDTGMAAISFVAALWLRLGGEFWNQTYGFLVEGTVLFTVIAVAVFVGMGLYRGVWRYASIDDLIAITKAVTLAVLLFLFAMFLLTRLELMPRSTLVINWLLLIALLGGPRFAYRLVKGGNLIGLADRGYDARIPVLLVGAGDRAESFLRAMRRPGERYRVVGMVDDARGRMGRNIHGVPVLGPVSALPEAVARLHRRSQRPRRLLIVDERLDGAAVGALLERADELGMTLARVPRLTDFQDGAAALTAGARRVELRPVALEDLLGRPQTRLDQEAVRALVKDRRVLVTGAGGTIGGELVRRIAPRAPARLVLLDSGEYNLYRIDGEAAERWPALAREAVLADVRDEVALAALFARLRPELVFHAAALKHVPIAEAHASEAVLTNVLGTRRVADLARAHGARAMVLISTDKAVNPASVMGASKRLAEAYCQALDRAAAPGGTRFLTVRFGNVLGSTGSVVPLFRRQLEAGGPLTVTDPEMTRYFMTAREAVELVLQASAMGLDDDAGAGGIYVLDMGEPVRIVDLARQMIRLAGLHPDRDIEIAFTGPRPGEKLHEELFHAGEQLVETAHEGIRLARPRAAEAETLARAIDAIAALATDHDDAAVCRRLQQLVPEYAAAAPGESAAAVAR
jgi:O-antigen biosynthesis protein WbqV